MNFFFKIHIAELFQSSFGQALLNQQPFPEILAICYLRALWAGQACLTTPKKNFMIKLQFPWISYYMQKANFLPQIVFDIKILKIMQSDQSRVFSIKTQELDFSQPCGFYRFSKVVHNLKPKNHIDGTNLSSKSVLPIFFSERRA